MKSFSISEAVNFGWETTKKNFIFLLKVVLIIAAVYIVTSFIQNNLKGVAVLGLVATILFWIIHVVIDIGLIKIALKLVSSQTPTFEDLYDHYPLFWKYLGASLLSGLIVAGGFILLILPGVYFAVKLQFVNYFIVDKNMGPIEAIQASWNMTKGNWWNLFLMDILLGLINIGGAILLGIGLLWTIPTTTLATAHVYKKLTN